MQSPIQSNTGPNPVNTATTEKPLDTETEAQPAQSEPDAQKVENKSAAPAETDTPVTPQENGTRAEAPASVAHSPLPEPSDNTAGMELDSASKPNTSIEPVPDMNTNPGCDGQKEKKQDEGARDGRKYVPSKKAMVDPLKIDMSKHLAMPLTCEYYCVYVLFSVTSLSTGLGLRHQFGPFIAVQNQALYMKVKI